MKKILASTAIALALAAPAHAFWDDFEDDVCYGYVDQIETLEEDLANKNEFLDHVQAQLVAMTQHKDNWKEMALSDNGSLWSERFENVKEDLAEMTEHKNNWKGMALSHGNTLWSDRFDNVVEQNDELKDLAYATDGQSERHHKEGWKAIAQENQALLDLAAAAHQILQDRIAELEAQLED